MARHLSIAKKLRTGMRLNVAQSARLGVLNKAQRARLAGMTSVTPSPAAPNYNPYADAAAFGGGAGSADGSDAGSSSTSALDAAAAPGKWFGIALIGAAALTALYLWRSGGR